MARPAAPLAAAGALLALLALAALARPRRGPSPPSHPRPATTEGSETRRRLLREEPIDVNLASAEELELLPHIGPTLARRIVEDRERGGRFERLSELGRVHGIGPRTLERLGPLVTLPP